MFVLETVFNCPACLFSWKVDGSGGKLDGSSISVLPEFFTFQREMEIAGILVFRVRVHVFVYDPLSRWKRLLGQPVLPAAHSVQQRRILVGRGDST